MKDIKDKFEGYRDDSVITERIFNKKNLIIPLKLGKFDSKKQDIGGIVDNIANIIKEYDAEMEVYEALMAEEYALEDRKKGAELLSEYIAISKELSEIESKTTDIEWKIFEKHEYPHYLKQESDLKKKKALEARKLELHKELSQINENIIDKNVIFFERIVSRRQRMLQIFHIYVKGLLYSDISNVDEKIQFTEEVVDKYINKHSNLDNKIYEIVINNGGDRYE